MIDRLFGDKKEKLIYDEMGMSVQRAYDICLRMKKCLDDSKLYFLNFFCTILSYKIMTILIFVISPLFQCVQLSIIRI